MTTLREYISKHELSPEDNGLGLEWYRPDEMIFVRKTGNIALFSDGCTRCVIEETGIYSKFLSEDDEDEILEELDL